MLGSTDIVAFVPITDAGEARAFYEGVLGLRFVNDDGFALVFDANGIMVRAAKMKEVKPAQFTVLGWQVKEIENVVSGHAGDRACSLRSSDSSSRTNWGSGPRRPETKWRGSRIPTGIFCRSRNTFKKIE